MRHYNYDHVLAFFTMLMWRLDLKSKLGMEGFFTPEMARLITKAKRERNEHRC